MNNPIRLLMIGAMYENGGNTTLRFLDGHPQMFVYPFESQVGTRLVNDQLSSMFPLKYRWPTFALDASPAQDYHAIIDEECKVRARTPNVSKFRDATFDFSDDEREKIYLDYISKSGRSRGDNVAAFFQSTFDAWKDCHRSGQETYFIGYSPILVVDVAKIFFDLPNAHFLHVVRNPWSAFADTKKRPVPLSLSNYMLGWTLNQYYATYYQEKYPDRMHLIRIEDVMANSYETLGKVCVNIELDPAETLRKITWNGRELEEVYPWGTIRKATPEDNINTGRELTVREREEISAYAWQYLDVFDYQSIKKKINR
jgi:hypothetical protein